MIKSYNSNILENYRNGLSATLAFYMLLLLSFFIHFHVAMCFKFGDGGE